MTLAYSAESIAGALELLQTCADQNTDTGNAEIDEAWGYIADALGNAAHEIETFRTRYPDIG